MGRDRGVGQRPRSCRRWALSGEVNAYGLGFGPQEVGQWRARTAMEVADHEQAAWVAEGLAVQTPPLRSWQADYWVT